MQKKALQVEGFGDCRMLQCSKHSIDAAEGLDEGRSGLRLRLVGQ